MKCLRCGRCCAYPVVIVKSSSDKFDYNFEYKEDGVYCRHFSIDEKTKIASCSIHKFEWFKDTPCGKHTQIGKSGEPCRIGKWIRDNNVDVHKFYKKGGDNES